MFFVHFCENVLSLNAIYFYKTNIWYGRKTKSTRNSFELQIYKIQFQNWCKSKMFNHKLHILSPEEDINFCIKIRIFHLNNIHYTIIYKFYRINTKYKFKCYLKERYYPEYMYMCVTWYYFKYYVWVGIFDDFHSIICIKCWVQNL